MKPLEQQMGVYQSYHSKEVTKITHFVGVPCVFFGVLIALSWIHISIPNVFNISLAWIATFALIIYYFFLDMLLALATAVGLLLLTYIAQLLTQGKITTFSFALFFIFFVGGWIMQLLGHYFEGKWPAFTKNLDQLLVAPIFMVAEGFFAVGYKKKLQHKVLDLAGH